MAEPDEAAGCAAAFFSGMKCKPKPPVGAALFPKPADGLASGLSGLNPPEALPRPLLPPLTPLIFSVSFYPSLSEKSFAFAILTASLAVPLSILRYLT